MDARVAARRARGPLPGQLRGAKGEIENIAQKGSFFTHLPQFDSI